MKTSKSCLFIAALLGTVFLFSCGDKVECSGTVVSPKFVPMPNEPVRFIFSRGGKEQDDGFYTLTTDKNGHFDFSGRESKRKKIKSIWVNNSDSGRAEVFFQPGAKNIQIVLHK